MYYEFESRLNMKPLIFDDEKLKVGDAEYRYEDIEAIELIRTPIFSTYGILKLTSAGKEHTIPFPRSYKEKMNRVLRELERERTRTKAAAGEAQSNLQPAGNPAADPYEEMKKLKELLDLEIITQDEFDRKKKELLGL